MPRHVDWEIQLHLETVKPNDLSNNKDDYFKAIEDRYAAKYLDALGVEPLPHHKAMVSRRAPLGDCKFAATWSESSAVASRLSILQPSITGSTKEDEKPDDNLSGAQRTAEWFGRAQYLSVLPPDPPAVIAAHFDLEAKSKAKAQAAKHNMKMRSLAAMQLQDFANSTKTHEHDRLTDELERTRAQIRSDLEDASDKANMFGRLLKKKGRRDADEIELEVLKVKFLLPFACERAGSSTLLPWQSPELRMHPSIHVHEDFLADAKKPICLTMPEMEQECFEYAVMRFPVELLTTRADPELFAAVKEQLVTEEAVRLIGLLAHFLYWIVLEHIHEPDKRLPEQSKQSLLLTIQELWGLIQAPARQRLGRRGELLSKDGPAGISFVIPAFVLALKRGVEWVFQVSYPWIFAEAQSTTQLIDQINILFMRLFDPDCLYASFGALEASERAIKLWYKLGVLQASMGITPARRIIYQEYRTTPLMKLLMGGNAGDPKTRMLLSKSPSESMIVSLASRQQDPHKAQETVPLEGWRRAALYRSANKRLQKVEATTTPTDEPKKTKGGFMKRKSVANIRSSKSRSGTHTRSSERTSTIGSESASLVGFESRSHTTQHTHTTAAHEYGPYYGA